MDAQEKNSLLKLEWILQPNYELFHIFFTNDDYVRTSGANKRITMDDITSKKPVFGCKYPLSIKQTMEGHCTPWKQKQNKKKHHACMRVMHLSIFVMETEKIGYNILNYAIQRSHALKIRSRLDNQKFFFNTENENKNKKENFSKNKHR